MHFPLRFKTAFCLLSLTLTSLTGLHSKPETPPPSGPQTGEQVASKSYTLTKGTQQLRYTTTAGKLLISDEKNAPMAEVFYIAYTQNDAKANERPITFFWDGGPGGCSLAGNFLGFGPLRYTPKDGEPSSPPYQLEENPHTLLHYSDLVYIDAIGTGYSRAVGQYQDKDFWGIHPDADAITLAIERYLKLNQRWQSPKFISGVSYGTSRAAMVSHLAQQKGIGLNGVILIASALNFGLHSYGLDQEAATYLPTFAAIAWHHGKGEHTGLKLPEVMEKARQFTHQEYLPALFQGNTLAPEERDTIANKLAGLIGLDKDYLLRANLRVSTIRFRKELLRDQGITLGRMDGRIKSTDFDAVGEEPESDPWVINDYFIPGTAALHHAITSELGYRPEQHYIFGNTEAAAKWNWSYTPPTTAGISRSELDNDNIMPLNAYPAAHLGAAMRTAPTLQVYQANAYFDLATPFAWAEYDLSHITYSPQLISNIHSYYYNAGHGIFMDNPSLAKMHRDLGEFYNKALSGKKSE